MRARIPSKISDWPLWWFSRLEAAIERGDYLGAAKAQRELERLGVIVIYRGRQRVRPARRVPIDVERPIRKPARRGGPC